MIKQVIILASRLLLIWQNQVDDLIDRPLTSPEMNKTIKAKITPFFFCKGQLKNLVVVTGNTVVLLGKTLHNNHKLHGIASTGTTKTFIVGLIYGTSDHSLNYISTII